MAWIDDIDVLNNAATSGNWTASGFDSPTLNDNSATTPIYLEGSACMWWPLKKGTTNGYTYTSTISGTPSMTGRIVVGFVNYPFADIQNIPITAFHMRMSSSTGFTSNYAQWDASAQVLSPENIPISGHTPVIGYPDAATETGTPNYGAIESIGWVATTGNDNDGKQGGFDWFFVIGWVGAHSATYTNTFFSGLYDEYYDNGGSGLPDQTSRPIAVLSQAGNFFQTNIRFQLGDGSSDTANIVVSETGKTIFFNNLHVNHELGYVFVDPNSTHQIQFTLTDVVHLWNDQATTNDVFENASNCSIFRLTGCAFSKGGRATLPAWISDANTYVINTKFDGCGVVDIGSCFFEDNTVSGATLGIIYDGTSNTRRAKRTSYTNNTTAVEFNTVGNFDLDGDTFSGNTYDIENSGNAATITAGSFVVGRAYKILTVGTTDFTAIGSADNSIGTKFVATGVGTGTGTATEVLLINALNGANPSAAKINNTGTNADTLIQNAVTVSVKAVTVTGTAISGVRVRLKKVTGGDVVLEGLTDGLGVISTSYNYSSDEAVEGYCRKSTSTPFYKEGIINGTITTAGFNPTVAMVLDE